MRIPHIVVLRALCKVQYLSPAGCTVSYILGPSPGAWTMDASAEMSSKKKKKRKRSATWNRLSKLPQISVGLLSPGWPRAHPPPKPAQALTRAFMHEVSFWMPHCHTGARRIHGAMLGAGDLAAALEGGCMRIALDLYRWPHRKLRLRWIQRRAKMRICVIEDTVGHQQQVGELLGHCYPNFPSLQVRTPCCNTRTKSGKRSAPVNRFALLF